MMNSLRFRLLASLVLVLVPPGLLSCFQAYKLYDQAVRVKQEAVMADILQQVHPILAELQAGERILLTLAAMSDLWTLSPSLCERRLADLAQVSPMAAILALVDGQGKVVCSWPQSARLPKSHIAIEKIPVPTENGTVGARISNHGALSGVPVIGQYMPFVRNGAIERMVLVSLKQRNIRNILDQVSQDTGASIALVSEDNQEIYSGNGEVVRPIFKGDIVTKVPLYRESIFLLVSPPPFDKGGKLAADMLFIIATPVLSWLAAFLVTWLVISRVVVGPVYVVRRFLGRWRGGNFTDRVPTMRYAAREIQDLIKGVNDVAEAVVQREGSLQEMILEQKALTREVHHRVRNNLQIITSMINIDMSYLSNDESIYYMSLMRDRMYSILSFYNLALELPNVSSIFINKYIFDLVRYLSSSDGFNGSIIKVSYLEYNVRVDMDCLVALSLLVAETLNFAMNDCQVNAENGLHLILRQSEKGDIELEIRSSGDCDKSEQAERRQQRVWRYITSYARKMKGEIRTVREDLPTLILVFPAASS